MNSPTHTLYALCPMKNLETMTSFYALFIHTSDPIERDHLPKERITMYIHLLLALGTGETRNDKNDVPQAKRSLLPCQKESGLT